MTYFSDLPLPDLTIREGDCDPRDFVLRQGDGITPVDLTSRVVELRLRPYRGTQSVLTYRTNASSPALYVTSPTGGAVRLVPPAVAFDADAERYRGYFAIYEAADTLYASPKTVPQPRDLWIEILPKVS